MVDYDIWKQCEINETIDCIMPYDQYTETTESSVMELDKRIHFLATHIYFDILKPLLEFITSPINRLRFNGVQYFRIDIKESIKRKYELI